ncbi:MAG: ATP-dependent DNA ligase, partial [Lautropia sp.]
PSWLVEECYEAVGDTAETIALLVPPAAPGATMSTASLADWIQTRLLPLRGMPGEEVIQKLTAWWSELDSQARFVCGKLITGNFRVGVSRLLVTRALAAVSGVDARHIAHRLVGYTDIANRPQAIDFERLIAPGSTQENDPRSSIHPYPFFLAQSLQQPIERFPDLLGSPSEWLIEWKWDGIRAQLVKRAGQVALWSRGEELVTDRFPEVSAIAGALPDGTVLDGEIVAWQGGRVQPFALLQQRLGRKKLSARLLNDNPVCLLAFDLIEWQGQDCRTRSQGQRRLLLERLIDDVRTAELLKAPCEGASALQISPLLGADDWESLASQRAASRSLGVEGMMLKSKRSGYGVGRTVSAGAWWKWKVDPFTIDAVLIYAQRGHGRRAGLFSDYTFAVWDGNPETDDARLVPFAKAYSGLTDAELAEVDAIVRRTTVEKFGPVHSVTPSLVFELGFEGIARSSRHKSGIAVRFPRMLRWRRDKTVPQADTLQTLSALLASPPPDPPG